MTRTDLRTPAVIGGLFIGLLVVGFIVAGSVGDFGIMVLSGLFQGMLLFLVASGLSIIFGLMDVLNFAQGAYFMLGAYVAHSIHHSPDVAAIITSPDLRFILSVLIAVLVGGVLGVILERYLLRPLYVRPLFQLVLTFGVALVMAEGIRLIWSTTPYAWTELFSIRDSNFVIFGQQFSSYRLFVIVIGFLLMISIALLLRRTRIGIIIRAGVENSEMVEALGINVRAVFTLVFTIGCAVAAFGGAIAAPFLGATPGMGNAFLLAAIAVVALGGLGSYEGTAIGSILVGFGRVGDAGLLRVGESARAGEPDADDFAHCDFAIATKWFVRAGDRRMKAIRHLLQSNWFYVGILALLILLPHLVGWLTGDSPFGVGGRPRGQSIFWQGIMIEVFILAILAMSYNLIFGFTGVISFGHALFFGVSGYTLGIILEKTEIGVALGLPLGIILGIAIAGALGLLVGLVSLRLKGVYFALFTLAIAEMFFIFASRWAFTAAEDGFTLRDVPDWLDPTRSRINYYYITLVLLIFTFMFIRRLMASPTGAVLLAIRENENRAKSIGYNTLRFKLFAITVSAMLAAAAGILHMVFNKKVGPELLGLGFTVDPLLMTIIGGLGTFSGPAVGATILHLGDRLLRDSVIMLGAFELNIGEFWNLILGIFFIVVVMVFPSGVVGTWHNWRARRRAKQKPATPQPDDPVTA